MSATRDRITLLLQSTDPDAAEQLLPLVYEELRKQARRGMAREKPGQTLQATALVHEVYLRLTGGRRGLADFQSRRHFFGASAEAMRRILLNQARRRRRLRHGANFARVDADADHLPIEEPGFDVLAIDEALAALEQADPRAREIVNLRFFVGLTVAETAAILGVSVTTVEREWRFIRTFLQDELGDGVQR